MNKAYVFQEKYTGLQIFVYHAKDEFDAKSKLSGLVVNQYSWIYLGQKTAKDVK